MIERRYATILFCDLAGYTALSERLDLEDLRDLQGRYQRTAAGIIARWGGFVASFQGDGILAFFGYPAAHGTDAERGIRAALDLVDSVSGLDAGPHPPLAARVGLHTGLVVIGPDPAEAATGGHGAVGEAINLASRLQADAPSGAVVVSRETLELVEGLFDTEPLGPKVVRGLSRVVFVHRVLRVRAGADRGWTRSRRGATRMVGRDAPLHRLLGHWREVVGGAGQRTVQVVGEAGVGKTRLVQELCMRADAEGAGTLQANCLEIFTNTPLYPAASLLWSHTGLTAEDVRTDRGTEGRSEGRTKIAKFLHAFGRAATEEEVGTATGLLGLSKTPAGPGAARSPLIKQRQFALLTSLLERAMGDGPMLLWVEDAHWLDRSSAELLAHVAERFAERPLLVVLTTRPPGGSGGPVRTDATIRLEPLPLPECIELARAVPGARGLPDDVLRRAAEAADGVPFFAEQLTLSLIDQGAASGAGPEAIALPLTLAEMLSERLDRLGDARRIVQAASCVGRAFAPEPLAGLLGLPRAAVLEALEALVGAEILRPRHDGGETVYEFRHALLQRVAYDSMLGSQRRVIHGRIAEALRRGDGVGPVLPGIVAHHLTAAGRRTTAAQAWLEAGIEAARRSAHTEAVGHLRAGLPLLDGMPDPAARRRLELDLQASLIGPLVALHGTSSAELAACCRRGLQLCMEAEPTTRIFPFLFGLFTVSVARQRIREAVSLAELFLSVAEREGDDSGRVVGHRLLGTALLVSGEPQRAREQLELSLRLYSEERDRAYTHLFGHDIQVHGAALLSVALFCAGEVDAALRIGLDALRTADGLHHPYSAALVIAHVGGVLFGHCGAPDAQAREARRLIALAEQHRLGPLRAHGEAHLGTALCAQGDVAQGCALLEGAIAALDAIGNSVGLAGYLTTLAEARRRGGRFAEAEALCARALRMVRDGGEFWMETEAMRIAALAARDADPQRPAAAEALLRGAAALARQRGMPVFELWCLFDLSRLLGPDRTDPAVDARIGALWHLRDLDARAAAAFRQHGYQGGSWRPAAAAPRHGPWPHRSGEVRMHDAASFAPADGPPLPAS
jgi:class 3 adenylate cyclase/tetratricopeptide (TPR) repeat protein